jgi:hypothetical protein
MTAKRGPSRTFGRLVGGIGGAIWGLGLAGSYLFGNFGPHSPLIMLNLGLFLGTVIGLSLAVGMLPQDGTTRAAALAALVSFLVAFVAMFALGGLL